MRVGDLSYDVLRKLKLKGSCYQNMPTLYDYFETIYRLGLKNTIVADLKEIDLGRFSEAYFQMNFFTSLRYHKMRLNMTQARWKALNTWQREELCVTFYDTPFYTRTFERRCDRYFSIELD